MVGDLMCRSRCKRERPTTTSTIDSLPDDLLLVLLVCFPADYLHDVARLVCRRWYHFIRSHSFTNAHYQLSTYCLLFSYNNWCSSGRPSWMMTATPQGLVQTSVFSYIHKGRILGSCNGLMLKYHCNEKNTRTFKIINPVTKRALVLPPFSAPEMFYTYSGIAYAAASMEYKVALSYYMYPAPGLAILTAGVDASWRQVPVEQYLSKRGRTLLTRVPLLTEGFMHWVGQDSRGEMVVTLDVETEILTVSEVPFPSQNERDKKPKVYLSTGRSLSLLIGRGSNIWRGYPWEKDNRLLSLWEMNPETKEWVMLVDYIKLEAQQQNQRLQQLGIKPDWQMEPCGWVKYPEILVFSVSDSTEFKTVVSYNLNTHEINLTEIPGPFMNYTDVMYKSSLLWLT